MTTYENRPADETPDFTCPAGFICGGCQTNGNACDSTRTVNDEPCCRSCSHPATMPEPKVWNGSD